MTPDLTAPVVWDHRRDRPAWHPDDCNGPCCWLRAPDLTVCDAPVLTDCVAALAVIRAGFGAAHRAVEARYRRFAADCEQLARRIEEGAT